MTPSPECLLSSLRAAVAQHRGPTLTHTETILREAFGSTHATGVAITDSTGAVLAVVRPASAVPLPSLLLQVYRQVFMALGVPGGLDAMTRRHAPPSGRAEDLLRAWYGVLGPIVVTPAGAVVRFEGHDVLLGPLDSVVHTMSVSSVVPPLPPLDRAGSTLERMRDSLGHRALTETCTINEATRVFTVTLSSKENVTVATASGASHLRALAEAYLTALTTEGMGRFEDLKSVEVRGDESPECLLALCLGYEFGLRLETTPTALWGYGSTSSSSSGTSPCSRVELAVVGAEGVSAACVNTLHMHFPKIYPHPTKV